MCDVRILILTGLGYDHEAGIKATVLEDLDFADDINCATCHPGMHEKTGGLAGEAARVGLKFIAKKCKTLRTDFALSKRESIMDNGEEV